jgi:glycosyltransferase involved in cell wall biosynthesis
LAPRLVERGHEVIVYGRSNIIKGYKTGDYYKGVRLVILPTISHKYLDTIVHTFIALLHSVSGKYDIMFICNAANSIFAFIPRMARQKVVINVDGIERNRKKWNALGKLWYLMGEYFSTLFANRIVSDADVIRDYYLERYKVDSDMIPYGAEVGKVDTKEILSKFKEKERDYLLYVSRLEPENNAHLVIQAFKKVKTGKKLVIVGDASYAQGYKDHLRELAAEDDRIIFTGFVFGQGYKEFQSNAYCYVQATEVGGTHPALIESMGFGNCVIANGTVENIEVLAGTGLIYEKNNIEDLTAKLQYVLDNPMALADYQKRAQERVRQKYSWEAVTDKYEKLFMSLVQ